jgi:hypothetical protein
MIFWLTAIAAVLCLVGPWAIQGYREYRREKLIEEEVERYGRRNFWLVPHERQPVRGVHDFFPNGITTRREPP